MLIDAIINIILIPTPYSCVIYTAYLRYIIKTAV